MKNAVRTVITAAPACGLATAALVASAPPPASLATGDAAQAWPRLFYNAAQRQAIEKARIPLVSESPTEGGNGPAVPAIDPRFVLQGMAQGRRGASAWINGEMLGQGETIAGRTVQIEPQGVRLRQAGQPDIVLRPGQQGSTNDSAVQDLVPPDSFHKK